METRNVETNFQNFIWIDICKPDKTGLNDIAQKYKLDLFQIRDSLERGHLPKFERQKKYDFLILRGFTGDLSQRLTTITDLSNKVAFFYSKEKLITIHRSDFSFLNSINGNFKSAESLLVFIMQEILKTFEEPLAKLNDKNDEIERTIFLKDYTKISLEDLYFQKTQTRIIKKLLTITQNVINQVALSDESKTALQDLKDKLLSLTLSFDELLENSNNLLHTYMSVNSQKSNDVMKLLTVFSAFFLPLTFIAGIYGMNFENMPELTWPLGYFYTLGLMALIAALIYYWFKRKRILK